MNLSFSFQVERVLVATRAIFVLNQQYSMLYEGTELAVAYEIFLLLLLLLRQRDEKEVQVQTKIFIRPYSLQYHHCSIQKKETFVLDLYNRGCTKMYCRCSFSFLALSSKINDINPSISSSSTRKASRRNRKYSSSGDPSSSSLQYHSSPQHHFN